MDKTNINDFKSLLGSLDMEEDKIRNEIFVQKIRKAWPEIIGPVFLNHTEVIATYPGELVILTSHTMYKQEILFHQKRILEEVNQLFNSRKLFLKISIRIGKINSYLPPQEQKKPENVEIKNEYLDILKEEKNINIKKKLADILEGK